MRSKIFQKTMAIMLIMTLILAKFIFFGFNVVEAVYEELEQQNVTVNRNIIFDAYLKDGENKIHSKQAKISEGDNLYIHIKVENTGALNDAKIKIENANFKIQKEEENSPYIKEINDETNEITLNQIIYGNDIEIQIPIKFEKKDVISTEYFNMENNITLSGKYKESSEKDVETTIKTRVIWTDSTDTELSVSMEKYFSLGEEGVLLQQSILSSVKENHLPKESEKISVLVPVIDGEEPKEITVIENGKKLETEQYQYTEDTHLLEIQRQTSINEQSEISWLSGVDTYKVIYLYDAKIGEDERDINVDVKANTKLYTVDAMYEKEVADTVKVVKQGSSASIFGNLSSDNYKGYLYANSENETIYSESYSIEISQIKTIEKIQTKLVRDMFTYPDEGTYSTNGSTYYKSTKINKDNMIDILGNEGSIRVVNEDGMQLGIFNSSSEVNADGEMILEYKDATPGNIIIETTKPVKEGNLVVVNQKAIKGNTGYSKEQLRQFNSLQSELAVVTNLETANSNVMKMNLLDTKTEATLRISNSNLTTLGINKNVEIVATFKTPDNKYDLYKNMTVQIELPAGIEEIQVNSINKKYDEELEIQTAKLIDLEDGRKAISLGLVGEQTKFSNVEVSEGMQIVINADITFNKKTPTNTSQIVMKYSNENGADKNYQTDIDLNVKSKYGMVVYSKISGYNEENETVESIESKNLIGKAQIQDQKRTLTVQRTIINNYDKKISNLSIIGELPDIGEENINDETLKSTYVSKLEEAVKTNNEQSKVYYSNELDTPLESDKWQEQIDDIKLVKSYKVVLAQNELQPAQNLEVVSKIEIPENLSYNQSSYETMKITYTYEGQEFTETYASSLSTVVGKSATLEDSVMKIEEVDGVGEVKLSATSGGLELKEGQSIYEGQAIQYALTINNTTGKDIENAKVVIDYPNANLYDEEKVTEESVVDSDKTEEYTYVLEKEGVTSKTFDLGTIINGQSKTIKYQLAVKENVEELSGKITISTSQDKKEITTTNKVENAEIKASFINYIPKENTLVKGNAIIANMEIKNISSEDKQNVIASMSIPEYLTLETVEANEDESFTITKQTDTELEINIDSIKKDETATIKVWFVLNSDYEDEINLNYYVSVGNNTYTSNVVTAQAEEAEQEGITASQVANIEDKYINTGDKLNYVLTISNNTEQDEKITIIDSLPTATVIEKAYYDIEGNTTKVEQNGENEISIDEVELKVGEKMQLTVETTVDESLAVEQDVINEPYVRTLEEVLTVNPIQHTIKSIEEETKRIEEENQEGEDENTGSSENQVNEEEQNVDTISGIVWMDKNKNGIKEEQETAIDNITVKLLGTDSSEKASTLTNSEGKYEFKNIENGKYMVAFEYDTTKYATTVYKATGVAEDINSDITMQKVNDKNVGLTDVITIQDNNASGINAGLTENKIFDLKLDKYVNKIIVQNSKGTKNIEYQNTKLAKLELDAKQINGSLVIVEYKIDITNEGEVAGYANEIIDYMPSDMEFNSEINKSWYISGNNLHNVELSNEIINPGETKTITVTLIKTMTENNTGTTINTAEIAKSSNALSIEDKDSVVGNNKQGEDDISTAEVLISIRTGVGIAIGTTVIILILGVIGFVIYRAKRKGE